MTKIISSSFVRWILKKLISSLNILVASALVARTAFLLRNVTLAISLSTPGYASVSVSPVLHQAAGVARLSVLSELRKCSIEESVLWKIYCLWVMEITMSVPGGDDTLGYDVNVNFDVHDTWDSYDRRRGRWQLLFI